MPCMLVFMRTGLLGSDIFKRNKEDIEKEKAAEAAAAGTLEGVVDAVRKLRKRILAVVCVEVAEINARGVVCDRTPWRAWWMR